MRSLATGSRDLAGAAARFGHTIFVSLDPGSAIRPGGGRQRPTLRDRAGNRRDTGAQEGDRRSHYHTVPQPPDEGIELPPAVKHRLGPDQQRSWVIVSEGNDFIWPGPDLRLSAGETPKEIVYGFLPPRLFQAIRSRFLACARRGQTGMAKRTE